VFNKHSRIFTESGSLNILIVDVGDEKLAYIDFNRTKAPRKTTSAKVLKKPYERMQGKPQSMKIGEFAEMIGSYQYQVKGADYDNGLYVPQGKSHLNKQMVINKRKEAARDNYELIRPIVEDKDKRFDYLYTNRSQEHIKEISLDTGVKAAQISRMLSQFFSRGGCFNAMFPNYRYCGSTFVLPEKIAEGLIKRGRNSKTTNYRARTKEDNTRIEEHLKKLGKKNFDKLPYTKQYEVYDYIYQGVDEEFEDENGVITVQRVPLPESECISYDQYYGYVKTLENERKLHWLCKGEKQYLKEYESRLYRARDGIKGPGFRYEIDATVEDVYILFPYFTHMRLSSGRPTTYRVSCTYSGMVVGIHVGIGGPNWAGVLQALYNAFTDKVAFCARYGIKINPEDWPCYHVCQELTIDNGVEYPKDNMSQMLDEKMGMTCINYMQIYAGSRKGTVEGGFQQDKNDIIQFMPGYVPRIPEKGAKHASNLAVYTYDKFVQLLIVNTLVRNNQKFNVRLHDKAMSEKGVKATSKEVWNFGLKQYMNDGRGMVRSKEDVLFKLLPSAKASTTAHGIKCKGIFYECTHAASKGWLTDDKTRPVKSLDIRYFDGSTEYIWYKYEDKVYTAKISTQQSSAFTNKCWFDALHRMEVYSEEKAIQLRKEREARFAQKQFTEQSTKEALAQLKGTKVPSRNAPSPLTSTISFIQKKLIDQKTSNLFTQLLGDESRKPDVSVQISTKHQVTSNQFAKMYGDTNNGN